jgi:hypothetical protein
MLRPSLLGAGLAGACPTSKIVFAESAAIREQKNRMKKEKRGKVVPR